MSHTAEQGTHSPQWQYPGGTIKTRNQADSVLFIILKPNWKTSLGLCSSRNNFNWACTFFFLVVFKIQGIFEIKLTFDMMFLEPELHHSMFSILGDETRRQTAFDHGHYTLEEFKKKRKIQKL